MIPFYSWCFYNPDADSCSKCNTHRMVFVSLTCHWCNIDDATTSSTMFGGHVVLSQMHPMNQSILQHTIKCVHTCFSQYSWCIYMRFLCCQLVLTKLISIIFSHMCSHPAPIPALLHTMRSPPNLSLVLSNASLCIISTPTAVFNMLYCVCFKWCT